MHHSAPPRLPHQTETRAFLEAADFNVEEIYKISKLSLYKHLTAGLKRHPKLFAATPTPPKSENLVHLGRWLIIDVPK
jgi:hypothetical protein